MRAKTIMGSARELSGEGAGGRQGARTRQIAAAMLAHAPRDALIVSLLYANLVVFAAVLMGANGAAYSAVVAYSLTAFAAIGVSALLVSASDPFGVKSRWRASASAIVINDAALVSILLFDLAHPAGAEPSAAVASVTALAFISVPVSARLLGPFILGKAVIFGLSIFYILARADSVFTDIALISPLTLAFLLVIGVGYWAHAISVRQIKLQIDLETLQRLTEKQNARLARAVAAEKRERTAAAREHGQRQRLFQYVSHDLRQPIGALGYILFELDRHVRGARERGLIADALACVQSANHLIEDILQVERYSETEVCANMEKTALSEVFAGVEREFALTFNGGRRRLRIAPTELSVMADRHLLARIIRNLVANAFKYAPQSDVLLGARRRGPNVEIWVVDQGPGLAAIDPNRLFKDFASNDTANGGFGLGLAIARRLAEACGGALFIDSVRDRGVTCRVMLQRR